MHLKQIGDEVQTDSTGSGRWRSLLNGIMSSEVA